jgi:hypothetical protein
MSEASLPYAGSSGYSGTDTSEQRAREADTSGVTNERQRWVLNRIGMTVHRNVGITVKELRIATNWHHGIASSVLTCLHKDGRIARLVEKRDRCHVYVLPEHVNGRETQQVGSNKRSSTVEPTDVVGYRSQAELDQIEQAAFLRGYDAGLNEGVPETLAKIDAYLTKREDTNRSIAWVDELRAILNGEDRG